MQCTFHNLYQSTPKRRRISSIPSSIQCYVSYHELPSPQISRDFQIPLSISIPTSLPVFSSSLQLSPSCNPRMPNDSSHPHHPTPQHRPLLKSPFMWLNNPGIHNGSWRVGTRSKCCEALRLDLRPGKFNSVIVFGNIHPASS